MLEKWLIGELLVGFIFYVVAVQFFRRPVELVICAFCVGDGLRGFGGGGSALHFGAWAGAWSYGLPRGLGYFLQAVYASFAVIPLLVLIRANPAQRRAAAVVVLLDGVIHLLVPVAPPWMVGAAPRFAASLRNGSAVLHSDPNPVAAWPSLHVGLPAVMAERPLWALWTVLLAVAVVLLGEHWVVDVVGGVGLSWAARRLVTSKGWVRVEEWVCQRCRRQALQQVCRHLLRGERVSS